MSMMRLIWQCMFSPRLYKIYGDGEKTDFYKPRRLEKWGDKIIHVANIIFNIGLYTSPFMCMYIYKRGFFTIEESKAMARFFGGVGSLIILSYVIRGIGRAFNPKYVTFLRTLPTSGSGRNPHVHELRKYDFEFYAWPVNYTVARRDRTNSWLHKLPFSQCANKELTYLKRTSIQVLAYVAVHTFGLRLIFPGSLRIINALLWSTQLQGRTNLVECHRGKRSKLATAEGNHIDTMFVDNRPSAKGNTLVICCEGNSGFYEIGIMFTPISAGYSALGWNHPGFGGSTGSPYPSQEQNAIDAVIQFAITELGFKPESIVMFGWSIGGYVATWGAHVYPVQGLILDATFDDLLPLAQNQMPASWGLLVKEVIRSYVDLNIAELIADYDGPVQLVRRTVDEVICLNQGILATNRGNHLLIRLMESRHPETVDADLAYVPLQTYIAMHDTQRTALMRTDDVGHADRRMLQLINKYMRDYKSTHCTPLPDQMFESIMTSMFPGRL